MPFRVVYMAVLLVMLALGAGDIWAAEYEMPGERKASEILPPEILKGQHYRVREAVPTDGYMHQFMVDNEVLKAEPPPRLRQINAEKLSAMGVRKELQTQFLDHPAFTPRHDTILVGSLASMTNARGRDAFVKLALSADDEVSANFFTQMAETLHGYHETVSPIRQITVKAPAVLAQAANGSVLVPYPLDYGVWTQKADESSSCLLASYKGAKGPGTFELWVTGTLSPLARQQLTGRGVKVVENVDARIDFLDRTGSVLSRN
jgi:hypothetical protein